MLRRIDALARARHWSTNDVILHALQHGLRMSAEEAHIDADADGNAALRIDDWGHGEVEAFNEAVRALAAVQLGRRVSGRE
jgi:predicted transcriptional regulator